MKKVYKHLDGAGKVHYSYAKIPLNVSGGNRNIGYTLAWLRLMKNFVGNDNSFFKNNKKIAEAMLPDISNQYPEDCI